MITAADFVDEDAPNHFVCCASDIDIFRRGFPRIAPTTLGNGGDFIGTSKKLSEDGDLMYVRYVQQLGGATLIVYND